MKTTKENFITISEIANRAICERLNIHRDKLSLVMDIEFAHEACPMRLTDLLSADESNFIHDICGIQANINRETKELDNFFVPRYSI